MSVANLGLWALRIAVGMMGFAAAGWGGARLTGYEFTLRFVPAYAWVVALLLLTAALLWGERKGRWAPLAAPLCALYAVAVMDMGGWTRWAYSAPAMAGMLCAMALLFCCGGRTWLRRVCALLFTVLAVSVSLVLLIFAMFSRFSVSTVVRAVDSPDGRFTAVVRDVDQGALGGDTVVDVIDHRAGLDLGLFAFSKAPTRVHADKWLAYERMRLVWLDESTLEIDEKRISLQ